MRLPLIFAMRYVFSKKKTNAINIISAITALAFAVGAAAMLIILSALNGFETTLTGLFTAFDPALKVETIRGKTFTPDSISLIKINQIDEIADIAFVVEDNAVVKYGESQEIAIVKGVSENYNKVTQIDSCLVEGSFLLGNSALNGGVFGYELANKLGIHISNSVGFVTLYIPKKGNFENLNPEQNLTIDRVFPTGSFFVQEEIDGRYILVSLEFARRLFGYKKEVSALEVSVRGNADLETISKKISQILGSKFTVKNQYQQKESIYKIFRSEKLATFSILSFIVLIAAFNLAGALTMLIIEKEKDTVILRSMGVSEHSLKLIFIYSGLIIAAIGSILGLLIGGVICWLQLKFGLLSIENSVIDAYPVAIQPFDFVWIFIISIAIGLVTAWIPIRKIGTTP